METQLEMLAGGKAEGGFPWRNLESVYACVGRNVVTRGQFDWSPAVFLESSFRILLRRGLLACGGRGVVLDIRRSFGCYDAKYTFYRA